MSIDLSNFKNPTPPNNGGSPTTTPTPAITMAQTASADLPKGLVDLHVKPANKVYFRDDQIFSTLAILNKANKPNPLLIGEAGVGKTAIVEGIVNMYQTNDPAIPANMANLHFYNLDINAMQAGNSFVGQAQEALQAVIDFAINPDNHAVLFVDEIHTLMDSTDSQTQGMGQALKPYLSRGEMRLIGATTTAEAKKLYKDTAFKRRLESVVVPELSVNQTIELLTITKAKYADRHNLYIPDALINDVVELADRYYNQSKRPDNAADLIDQASSRAALTHQRMIALAPALASQKHELSHDDLMLTIQKKLNFSPLSSLQGLAANLKTKIIGQDVAMETIAAAVERRNFELRPTNRPVSFLLAGPTGTGKTETANQLAKTLFNDSQRVITLNMTEYATPEAINQLLGSPSGYVGSDSNAPSDLDGLIDQPFSVLVLNEFEKAAPQVQQTFMEALDAGIVTDRRGREIDFKHAIVIATTNAGVDAPKSVGFGANNTTNTDTATFAKLQGAFAPELLNRFDKLLWFDSLSKDNFTKIVVNQYKQLLKEVGQTHPNLSIIPAVDADDTAIVEALAQLIDENFDPAKNGRPARRVIAQVESMLIDALVAGQGSVEIK